VARIVQSGLFVIPLVTTNQSISVLFVIKYGLAVMYLH